MAPATELIGWARDGRFTELFAERGWDNPHEYRPVTISLTSPASGDDTETDYRLQPLAHKRHLAVYACPVAAMPPKVERARIARQLTASAHEHLIVFHTEDHGRQVWHWTRREPNSPARPGEIAWNVGENPAQLQHLLGRLKFTFQEDATTTLSDVIDRISAGIPADRVTRRFYKEFSTQRTAFERFIAGIEATDERGHYTAIMLNRLMFTWFLQAKGFLDGDRQYLQTRLDRITSGTGSFHAFYRDFLKTLFHGVLAASKRELDPEMRDLIGRVPYINGGIFLEHEIEASHPELDIPNEAFAALFAFFGRYTWHLDDRPLGSDNEINPDVLGYIFEKYVNQKEKGAYYTKEDVIGYISQNTIIPWLLDRTREGCRVAFDAENPDGVWHLLRDAPDEYIYPSMKHGVIDAAGHELPMPDALVAGEHDYAQRGGWNARASEPYALPTETWREYFHRRRRTLDLRDKLRGGEVHEIDDLITLNLDIRKFAQDIVELAGGPELIRAFWAAVRDVTILDPTVGSGAFLVAALKVVEPLASGLLERMEAALAMASGQQMRDFREVLAEAATHPNREYWVLRQIILRNLYGVDIEEEAVEICKLRLFLLLAAKLEEGKPDRIEPLPDIDFNIRSGNTLVGYATREDVQRASGTGQMALDLGAGMAKIDEAVALADQALQNFKKAQDDDQRADLPTAKAGYEKRIAVLRRELDTYLFKQQLPKDSFHAWRTRTQPFHWFAEFHSIVIGNGGFDVIIGNPPYVRASAVRRNYVLDGFVTGRCPDIYAMVLERAANLLEPRGRSGMIVPLSLTFSEDFVALRALLLERYSSWCSSYDILPSPLFTGAAQRCTIFLGKRSVKSTTHVSKLHRWRSQTRPTLFQLVEYVAVEQQQYVHLEIPRFSSLATIQAMNRIQQRQRILSKADANSSKTLNDRIYFAKAALNFASFFLESPPLLDATNYTMRTSSRIGSVVLPTAGGDFAALAALSGEVYMWYWWTRGDGFDVTNWVVADYVCSLTSIPQVHLDFLNRIGQVIWARRNEMLVFKHHAGQFVGNYNQRPLHRLTRRADLLLLDGLGLDVTVGLQILDLAQRTLLVNELAGERGIPDILRQKYPRERAQREVEAQAAILSSVDLFIRQQTGLSADELEASLASGYPQWPSLPD